MTSRTELANAIRALSMDAVQKAKSGHPGAPMGMADIAEVLWNDFLMHNPQNPNWYDRDRFVLSNGHGSMLLYSLLHLTGYELSIDDIKSFRQMHSKTPGHPEYGYAPGIETTTGPLGQGIANGVGMALAEKILAAQFNKEKLDIVDHNTYVFLGDGCMMEGISHEVCSLAGTLGLGKLIAFYDDNGISIDGDVEGWFTDDTVARFQAYGWQVIPRVNGHDPEEVQQAIETAKENLDQPTLICCKTIIGFGSPNKEGKEDCHGAPLGDEEILLTRKALNWTYDSFEIPEHVYQGWDAKSKGASAEQAWNEKFIEDKKQDPQEAAEFVRRMEGDLPKDFSSQMDEYIHTLQKEGASIASRKASQNAISKIAPNMPEILGGSADLAGSNLTLWPEAKGVSDFDASGNYIFYGVREFGMSAIMNGIALHKGFVAYGATFLMFMEYARNAIRMAALMKQRVIHVYTHDSIGLGEDGPTHQPVEQLTSLRSTPNLNTWRPCDTVESAVAWKSAIERDLGPTALIFSRQALAHQERSADMLNNIEKGGYILKDCVRTQVILLATGSEVELAVKSADILEAEGIATRVVSMPCAEEFMKQSSDYRDSVLPPSLTTRVAIEAAHKDYWYKFVGLQGAVVGMETFGESAPINDLMKHFGFTTENVVKTVKHIL
jgi:transketolase